MLRPRAKFVRRWVTFNTAALVFGYLLYTPIAHGVTGGHGRDLATVQFAAHCVALAVVAMIVASAQRHVLSSELALSWKRVPAAAVAFNIAFWLGYYQPYAIGPDTDMILGFVVLGSAMWIGAIRVNGHLLAAASALLGFPLAGIVGQLVLIIAMMLFDFTLEPRTSMLHHSVLWITTGGTAGLLGGWVSGLALARMLPALADLDGQAAAEQLRPDAVAPRG